MGFKGRDSLLVLTMSNVVHSSAVYRQHLCCDPARLWRGQEDYGIGDVLRFADAAHHCFCSKAFLRRLPIACATATARQIGSDEARRYCVHSDIVWAKLHGKALTRSLEVIATYARSAAPMTDADLIRFLDTQDQIYQQVVEELANGRKETHWMWFIFPQLTGLGRTGMPQHSAIHDLDQAKRYLADSILGPRLRQVVRLLMDQKGKSAFEILGR